jgi:hypothetical protein
MKVNLSFIARKIIFLTSSLSQNGEPEEDGVPKRKSLKDE